MNLKVIHISNNVTIYSSFYLQSEKKVILIGYCKTRYPQKLYCTITYNSINNKFCNKVESKIYHKINNHFYVINIYNFNNFNQRLFINGININPLVLNEDKYIYNCTLCITKFINYTAYTYLLEAITSYIDIGIDHIVIYYTSSSTKVYRILTRYEKMKIVEIIRWEINYETVFMKEYVYGQLWKYNDCLYKYKLKSKYMIFNDIDEVLWNNSTLKIYDIINNFDFKNFDVLYLYNRIFRKELLSNQNYTNSRNIPFDRYNHYIPDFSMFSYHNSCIYRENYLTKYILVNYTNIQFLGIHQILVFNKRLKYKYINKEILFLRHTRRVREDLINDCKEWFLYFSIKELHIINKIKKMNMYI